MSQIAGSPAVPSSNDARPAGALAYAPPNPTKISISPFEMAAAASMRARNDSNQPSSESAQAAHAAISLHSTPLAATAQPQGSHRSFHCASRSARVEQHSPAHQEASRPLQEATLGLPDSDTVIARGDVAGSAIKMSKDAELDMLRKRVARLNQVAATAAASVEDKEIHLRRQAVASLLHESNGKGIQSLRSMCAHRLEAELAEATANLELRDSELEDAIQDMAAKCAAIEALESQLVDAKSLVEEMQRQNESEHAANAGVWQASELNEENGAKSGAGLISCMALVGRSDLACYE